MRTLRHDLLTRLAHRLDCSMRNRCSGEQAGGFGTALSGLYADARGKAVGV